jgi:two-component system chemotaxis response regulator CheY
MNLTSELTALKNQNRTLPINERARFSCRLAKRLEKAGEYEAAAEALSEFWPTPGNPPALDGLEDAAKAEVLLRAGALACWLGSASQREGSQEFAKNLITQSVQIFENLAALREVAEAHSDLALCYWREGGYDEARINLNNGLALLGEDDRSELKATLLIRASIVEMHTQKLQDAMRFCDKAAPIVEESEDHALKGSFHIQYGLILRRLATPENREGYVDRALIQYAAASIHYEQAENRVAVAHVENNLGFLHFTIGRYRDAHEHLDRARRLFLQLKDVGTAAQVDETRARTFLAENRLREADRVIKAAVKVLERGGQQAVFAEALTTYGAIVARMGNHTRAAMLLQRAIVVAETVGDREGSGRARLTIVEELGTHTPLKQLVEIYDEAVALLEHSQDPATSKRLISCGGKVVEAALAEDPDAVPVTDVETWDGFSLRKEVTKLERILIERALRDAGGSVSTASKLLGFKHHQSLIGLLNNRHRELLPRRSVVRRRRHHLFSEPKRSKKKGIVTETQLRVLHVEDHKPVVRLVKDVIGRAYRLESCANGLTAFEVLKTDTPVDVLIVDNNLPGISGLELVLRARSLIHRRNLPILMLSSDDVEKEAWRAGVDAYLLKPEAADRLAGTVERLLAKRRK